MILFDGQTKKITCPSGDTGILKVNLHKLDGTPLEEHMNGVAVFSVCKQKTFSEIATPIHVALVANTATILLSNAFTRTLQPGLYLWDVRIVTDPEFDDDGNVICSDNTDEVHSLFSAVGLPTFEVTGVSVNV